MCDPVSATIAGAAALGAGTSAISASKARKAQRKAQASAEASAARQAQAQEEQFNRANQRTPDLSGLIASNKRAAGGGVGGTFLTGAAGALPGALGGVRLLGF